MKKSAIVQTSETEYSTSLEVRRPNLKYLHRLFQMNCGPDILAAKIFKTKGGKEFTESMGAFEAVRKRMGAAFQSPKVTLISVGDGGTPRTAGLFAFLTKWDCWSVDPALPKEKVWEVDRLHAFSGKVEDFQVERMLDTNKPDITVIVAVHSHANLSPFWKRIKAPKLAVEIPCCKRNNPIMHEPTAEYEDWGIHSPHRLVRIWSDFDHKSGSRSPITQTAV